MSRKANLDELAQFTTPEEQKQYVFDKLGDMSFVSVPPDMVLVSIYVQPEKTEGGIIRLSRSIEEDRYQGKVGLLLKKGPVSFKYNGAYKWGVWTDEDGTEHKMAPPEVGEWIFMRVNDAFDVDLKGIPCRMIESDLYKGGITDPTLIY